MQIQITFLSLLVFSATVFNSTHTLAQTQTPTPQITVVAPPGTNTEIVSVETHVVGPGEIQIGAPTPVAAAPAATPVVPAQSPTQDIHLQINLRLRVENAPAPAPVVVAPLPALPQAPQVALPTAPAAALQLRLEAPRRRYALPISFMSAGALTTMFGGIAAMEEEDLGFVPAIGAGLFVAGLVTMIIRARRFRRARRAYDQQIRLQGY